MGFSKEEMDSEIIKDVCKDILKDNKKELGKAFLDQVMTGESIIEVDVGSNKIRTINPMSQEGFEIKDNLHIGAISKETLDRVVSELEEFKPERNFTLGIGKEGYINYERALMESAGMDEKSISIKVQRLRNELPDGIYVIGG